ncbi:hypothetical protein niasHT_000036 [Heterodera trifolii]|uniref:Uncharacterized protein n=1 Tax=Heterodera trifolii TaxID=157864 RepID=A0ABD2MBX7_9BILA
MKNPRFDGTALLCRFHIDMSAERRDVLCRETQLLKLKIFNEEFSISAIAFRDITHHAVLLTSSVASANERFFAEQRIFHQRGKTPGGGAITNISEHLEIGKMGSCKAPDGAMTEWIKQNHLDSYNCQKWAVEFHKCDPSTPDTKPTAKLIRLLRLLDETLAVMSGFRQELHRTWRSLDPDSYGKCFIE